MNTLDHLREARGAVRQLKSLARSKCLTDRDFDRLVGKVDRALDEVMGPDTTPKNLPPFYVLNGGRQ